MYVKEIVYEMQMSRSSLKNAETKQKRTGRKGSLTLSHTPIRTLATLHLPLPDLILFLRRRNEPKRTRLGGPSGSTSPSKRFSRLDIFTTNQQVPSVFFGMYALLKARSGRLDENGLGRVGACDTELASVELGGGVEGSFACVAHAPVLPCPTMFTRFSKPVKPEMN